MSEDLNAEIENNAGQDVIAESSTAPEVAAETPEEPKKANKVQERINQLTRKNYEERQRVAELEARLSELEANKPQPKAPEITAPKEDQYENYEDYQAAQAKFVADTAANAAYDRITAENQAKTEEQKRLEREQVLQSKKKAFNDNVESKRANFENFEDVAYGHQFMDIDLAEQIFDMEKGPEVAYHLGSHLDEAERIFALPPVQRARELTKLEFQVEALNPKKVSDAPDPITPLGSHETVERDPDKMTADEWQQWRHEQVMAKNR